MCLPAPTDTVLPSCPSVCTEWHCGGLLFLKNEMEVTGNKKGEKEKGPATDGLQNWVLCDDKKAGEPARAMWQCSRVQFRR